VNVLSRKLAIPFGMRPAAEPEKGKTVNLGAKNLTSILCIDRYLCADR
jgi:hypothetical protein